MFNDTTLETKFEAYTSLETTTVSTVFDDLQKCAQKITLTFSHHVH